jgi:hypothetical protein
MFNWMYPNMTPGRRLLSGEALEQMARVHANALNPFLHMMLHTNEEKAEYLESLAEEIDNMRDQFERPQEDQGRQRQRHAGRDEPEYATADAEGEGEGEGEGEREHEPANGNGGGRRRNRGRQHRQSRGRR